jgi:hypothetical protein
MTMVGFPLLLIPLAVYNIIAFLMPGVSFADPLFRLPLVSGAQWPISLSDILLAIGVLLLLFEVIKGARPAAKYLTDHLLSLVVFGASAAEFLMWPKFGTSTYFLLSLLALVDFLSGIALRPRRVTQVAPQPIAARPAPEAHEISSPPPPEPEAEPVPEPAPAPVTPSPPTPEPPSAAFVAESVLMDHPEPKMAQPAVIAASEPEPAAVPSPEPQPETSAPAEPETPKSAP